MNSITKLARLPKMLAGPQLQALHLTSGRCMSTQPTNVSLKNFDPNNYNIPLRPVTLDDAMEPYGSWKLAYERENKRANKHLFLSTVALTTTLIIFYHSGVMDGLFMPNLDNIMEDTEPFNFDKEGRKTV